MLFSDTRGGTGILICDNKKMSHYATIFFILM